MMKYILKSLLVCLGVSACGGPLVGVNVEVVDEKTLLERQILGSYDELSKDLVLIASVRGVDESGKIKPLPFIAPGKEKALRATQSREFNRDDVEAFKKDGCAGENREGLISVTPCKKAQKDKKYASLVNQIVQEENRDRLIILARVVETSENLTEKDLSKLQKVFAQMNRDAAKPGENIQLENGSWLIKR